MSRTRSSSKDLRPILAFLAIGLFGMLACCWGASALVGRLFRPESRPSATPPPSPTPLVSAALTVAYSPEKEAVFAELVNGFNAQGYTTADGEPLRVQALALDPAAMLDAVLGGEAPFQAMTPDSSVWLEQLDAGWSQAQGSSAQVVGQTVFYAVSPVVIAAWESVADQIGWPEQTFGWQDLLARAQADENFRWSHPSTTSVSGLLAVLAEFYAAAGKTRGLTIEDVQYQPTLDYVARLERTVRYYGEGNEPALIEQALKEGRNVLDAFVVQEQMVVYFNQKRRGQERLVALYPVEGTMWQDHPLVLLETTGLTLQHRQAFAQFRDYLLSPDTQQLILSHGYRPVDATIARDSPQSPLTAENGVNPDEPKTTLQVPNISVMAVVRDVWWYTKRHANVILIADRSGSMRGDKLAQARQALTVFLEQIQSDQERVGLIQFSTWVETAVELDLLGRNRTRLSMSIGELEAGGDTALLDAVSEAYRQLEALGDTERINAVVVMTDGQENASYIGLRDLVRELQDTSPVQVLVFCVAYGDDADLDTLNRIAEPSRGRVLIGDPDTIRDLYKILSQYF